jgi:hypothetical protein
MLNGRQLRTLFQRFNKKYFGGRLPAYSIRVVHHMSRKGETGHCDDQKRVIKILPGMSDEEAISTLLHEMAHAATDGDHLAPWKKVMVRLRQAGAPLCGSDLSPDDYSSRRFVSKKHFRTVMGDILLDKPGITLHRAIGHFIDSEGGPERTIKGFVRRYPWARQVFRAAQKERARWQKAQQDFERETSN